MSSAEFEAEVAPLLPRLRAIALRLVSDRTLAEDALQEALLRAFRAWHQRRGAYVWPWMRRVVIHECWRLLSQQPKDVPLDPALAPDDTMPGPEESVLLCEEREAVRHAVEQMPAGYRVVLGLRHRHDLTERAVAEILGLPLGTVQWRLKRAHDHLRQVLTHPHAPRLSATIREVVRTMEIRVETDPPASQWSPDRQTLALAEAQARLPGLRIPSTILSSWFPEPTVVLSRFPAQSPHAGRIIFAEMGAGRGLFVSFRPPESLPTDGTGMTYTFPGADASVDEDTQIGGRPGHWTQLGDSRPQSPALIMIWWVSTSGALWHIGAALPAHEMRQIAEAIEAEATPMPQQHGEHQDV